ncbi:MAG: iron-containing alcohol dehydrogenase [Thermodesulfobacteriota bacterium]
MQELKALIRVEAGEESLEAITLEEFVLGTDKIFEIPAVLNRISQEEVKAVLLVSDETPIKRKGVLLRDLISEICRQQGMEVEELILKGDDTGLLHADMNGVMAVKSRIRPQLGVIAIGGGTIADICKYAVFLSENEGKGSGRIPLIVHQTATSGSAFGSNQSVIFKEGVKRTLRSIYPTAIVADMDVIKDGPSRLNLSGFGDMIGILISSVDWFVSHQIGMAQGYSPLLVGIMEEAGKTLLDIGGEVGRMSTEGLQKLDKILIMMGIVSSMGFGTTPISGFEHMISHALDLEGMATRRKLSLHGAQVGLGTAYASIAYHLFLREFDPDKIDWNRCYPSDQESLKEVEKRFASVDADGQTVREIWTHYHDKLKKWRSRRKDFEEFLADWQRPGGSQDTILRKLPPPKKVIRALSLSGNPVLPEELTPPLSKDQMKFALLNARFMRDRFVMGDILGFTGTMDDRFWERVDQEVRRLRIRQKKEGGDEGPR